MFREPEAGGFVVRDGPPNLTYDRKSKNFKTRLVLEFLDSRFVPNKPQLNITRGPTVQKLQDLTGFGVFGFRDGAMMWFLKCDEKGSPNAEPWDQINRKG